MMNNDKPANSDIRQLNSRIAALEQLIEVYENSVIKQTNKLYSEIAIRKHTDRLLTKSEARFRTLVENTSDWVWEVDENAVYTYASPRIYDLLGYKPEEVLGKTPFDFMPSAEAKRVAGTVGAIIAQRKPIVSLENLAVHKEGYSVVLETSGVPFFDETGAFKGFRGIDRDITERKRVEEVMRELNEQLEIKVEERTKQLLEAQEELVRKEKLSILGQLSGSVGHELRNPLGVMSNAVYYLKMVLAESDKTTREYLEIIKHEIDNSLRIINDLLDFARTKTPQINKVMVRELIYESLSRCALPENIDVRTEIPDSLPEVSVDPLQMGQVLQNLITNAGQAMRDGGVLLIVAREFPGSGIPSSSPEFDGDRVEISITDTGEGISPENMRKLFQPLFTTKVKGIGLGLVVCRNLVEANGGRIKAASEVGKGTTFTVMLPIARGET